MTDTSRITVKEFFEVLSSKLGKIASYLLIDIPDNKGMMGSGQSIGSAHTVDAMGKLGL